MRFFLDFEIGGGLDLYFCVSICFSLPITLSVTKDVCLKYTYWIYETSKFSNNVADFIKYFMLIMCEQCSKRML